MTQHFPDENQQAEEVFAEYLELREEGRAPSREQLLQRHPQFRNALTKMLRGQETADGFHQRLRGNQDSPPIREMRPWRRALPPVLIAVSLLVLAVFVVIGDRSAEPLLNAPSELVTLSDFVDSRWGILEQLSHGRPREGQQQLAQDLVNLHREIDQTLAQFRHSPRASRLPLPLSRTLEQSSARANSLPLKKPIENLGGLSGTGVVLSFLEFLRSHNLPTPSPDLSMTTPSNIIELYRQAAHMHELPLRVVDLDGEAADLSACQVFAQSVQLDNGQIQEARYLGSLADRLWLEAGDWRITVQHPPTRRHSVLRLLVFPGLEIAPQIAFLRESSSVTSTMVEVPRASFFYGSSSGFSMHHEPQEETLPKYWIDPCEATNGEYAKFYEDTQREAWFSDDLRPKSWTAGEIPFVDPRLPVCGLSWHQASRFANWSGKRLLTDREWERAAQGDISQNRIYPWGNVYSADAVDDTHVIDPVTQKSIEQWDPTSVDAKVPLSAVDDPAYWRGASVIEGARVYRLADSVREWTEDILAYPDHGIISFGLDATSIRRTIRGCSWSDVGPEKCKIDLRTGSVPTAKPLVVGARCAKSPYPDFPAEH